MNNGEVVEGHEFNHPFGEDPFFAPEVQRLFQPRPQEEEGQKEAGQPKPNSGAEITIFRRRNAHNLIRVIEAPDINRGRQSNKKNRGEKLKFVDAKCPDGSIFYRITSDQWPAGTVAEPWCQDVGMFDHGRHLRSLSVNAASIDEASSKDISNTCFANQLQRGDMIIVHEIGYVQHPRIDVWNYTVLRYDVVERNYQHGSLAVGIMKMVADNCRWVICWNGKLSNSAPINLNRRGMTTLTRLNSVPKLIVFQKCTIMLPSEPERPFACDLSTDYSDPDLMQYFNAISSANLETPPNYIPFRGQLFDFEECVSVEEYLKRDLTFADKVAFAQTIRATTFYTTCEADANSLHLHRGTMAVTNGAATNHGIPDITLHVQHNIEHWTIGTRVKLYNFANVRVPVVAIVRSIRRLPDTRTITMELCIPVALEINEGQLRANAQLREDVKNALNTTSTNHVIFFQKPYSKPHDPLQMINFNNSMESFFGTNVFERLRVSVHPRNLNSHPENNAPLRHYRPPQNIQPDNNFARLFSLCCGLQPTMCQLNAAVTIAAKNKANFHIVEAPFGSGKSFLIANTAVAILKHNALQDNPPKIWIVAPSNKATTRLIQLFLQCGQSGGLPTANFPTLECRPMVFRSRSFRDSDDGALQDPLEVENLSIQIFIHYLARDYEPNEEGEFERETQMLVKIRESGADYSAIPAYKIAFLRSKPLKAIGKEALKQWLMYYYQPNIIFCTNDMMVQSDMLKYNDVHPDFLFFDQSGSTKGVDMFLMDVYLRSLDPDRPSHFVLVGDKYQLSPYDTNSAEELEIQLLDVFRCHEDTVSKLGRIFYDRDLQASGSRQKEDYLQTLLTPSLFPNPKFSYCFVIHDWHHRKSGSSFENPGEKTLIVDYIRSLHQMSAGRIHGGNIVCISPFRGQQSLLSAASDDDGKQETRTSTVSDFQGQEADVVIVSMALSRLHNKEGKELEELKLLEEQTMLVALSRSVHFTTIFINGDIVRRVAKLSAVFREAEKEGNVIYVMRNQD